MGIWRYILIGRLEGMLSNCALHLDPFFDGGDKGMVKTDVSSETLGGSREIVIGEGTGESSYH